MAHKKAAKPLKAASGDKATKKSSAKPATDQALLSAAGVLPAGYGEPLEYLKTRVHSVQRNAAECQTQLVCSLSEPLRSNLPTIEQIEEERGGGA